MNGNLETVGYRYITRQPGVRGGRAIIEGTRVGVHDVISLLQNGETVDSVVIRCFPNITAPRCMSASLITRTTAARSTCLWLARCPRRQREVPARPRRAG